MPPLYSYYKKKNPKPYFGINIGSFAATKKWRDVFDTFHPFSPELTTCATSTVAGPGNVALGKSAGLIQASPVVPVLLCV